MLKSTLDKVTSDAGLVTPCSIGSRVLVANSNNEVATSGVLRFVGELEGQDGLFCGVELPEAFGKNDGSYKGVYFFRCPQNHGLFLPIHRVRLAEKRQSQSSRMPMQRPDRLIKSVFPSINSSLIGSQHCMDVSMMSTNSSNWVETSDDDVDMFDSCTTYNVARPQFMLQEIEDPRPLFAMDEDEYSPGHDSVPGDIFSNGNICTSYVVTNPMMDRRDLPIIGTPPVTDDLETPLVEENPINGNFIHDTSTNNYAISENIIFQPGEKTTVSKTPEKNHVKSPANAKTPTAASELTPQQQQEKREKKQRVSLRELIATPAKPIQQQAIEKPKKISKQQQLMDQILNNMKEKKDVPKKEKSSRPKLSDLWSQPPPHASQSNENVKDEEGMTQQKSEEEKSKRALKVLNHPPAKPRNPPKPRQSLLPPKVVPTLKQPSSTATENGDTVKMRPSTKNVPGFKYGQETKTPAATRNSQTDASSGAESEAAPTAKRTSRLAPIPRRPTSQISVASSKSSTTTTAATSKAHPSHANATGTLATRSGKPITRAIKKPNEFERKLIHHYKRVSRISTVMSLVSGNIAVQLDALQFKYNLGNDTITAKNLEIQHLQTAISNLEESYKEQIKNLKEQHQEEVEKLQQTKDSEYQQIIKEIKQTHLAEIDDRDVSYLQVDTQFKEAQRKIEELRKALNEGTDAKITTLTLEIKSLQDMLEIKNKETTELLKSKNRLVALQEKFDELEKDYKSLQCEHEQESYNFKMNRDVNRSLRADNHKKDYKIEELLFKIDKLEKRQKIYQQRIDELETTNHASGLANHSFLEGSFNNSFVESEEDSTENDTDSEKLKRRSLLSTYQEAGRKAMVESVHQDVIHCPEGKYHEEDEDDDTASHETPLLESDDPETF